MCACEIIGGVAFPVARGQFNYVNLFFAKCFSLANSQKFDSRINNRFYGTPLCWLPYMVLLGVTVDSQVLILCSHEWTSMVWHGSVRCGMVKTVV